MLLYHGESTFIEKNIGIVTIQIPVDHIVVLKTKCRSTRFFMNIKGVN